jgi:hypothetical protein
MTCLPQFRPATPVLRYSDWITAALVTLSATYLHVLFLLNAGGQLNALRLSEFVRRDFSCSAIAERTLPMKLECDPNGFEPTLKFSWLCAIPPQIEGKLQIRQFARIAQIYAVPVSEIVRKSMNLVLAAGGTKFTS